LGGDCGIISDGQRARSRFRREKAKMAHAYSLSTTASPAYHLSRACLSFRNRRDAAESICCEQGERTLEAARSTDGWTRGDIRLWTESDVWKRIGARAQVQRRAKKAGFLRSSQSPVPGPSSRVGRSSSTQVVSSSNVESCGYSSTNAGIDRGHAASCGSENRPRPIRPCESVLV